MSAPALEDFTESNDMGPWVALTIFRTTAVSWPLAAEVSVASVMIMDFGAAEPAEVASAAAPTKKARATTGRQV
jgi:hypothetical protein